MPAPSFLRAERSPDVRRAFARRVPSSARVHDDPLYSDSPEEKIITSALVPAALGDYESDRYDNSMVYILSFLGCFFVVFGIAAICVAAYRIGKHRPHATRGLVVAIVATVIGAGALAAVVTLV